MKENILTTLKSLKHIPDASPSLTFKRNARMRLLARIHQENSLILPRRTFSAKWAYSLAFAVILIFFGSGTVFAAQSSLPSDPLYPIKTASEKVALLVSSPFPELKSKVAEGLVNRRENEYRELEKNNRPDLLDKAYENYQKSLKGAKDAGSSKNEDTLLPKSQPKQEAPSSEKKITPPQKEQKSNQKNISKPSVQGKSTSSKYNNGNQDSGKQENSNSPKSNPKSKK